MTVTYDTEHRVMFKVQSPDLATSRSVSTKIVEAGGADHGFLWKLNSYWRYSQIGANVLIEVESLSLSREVPTLLAGCLPDHQSNRAGIDGTNAECPERLLRHPIDVSFGQSPIACTVMPAASRPRAEGERQVHQRRACHRERRACRCAA